MSSCADVFIELLSTKNGAVGAVVTGERKDFQMCAGSLSLAAEVNSRVFWSSNNMLEDSSHWFTHGRRFPRLLLNSTEARCFVSVDVQMASSTDVFLGAAKHELWCTCSQRRRRFKKRNIAEKVNGTCKQDFTCRNGLIAVPTVNKDFSCCETTQQKLYYQASIVNTYVWRIAATKPWVHRTDNLNIGPCMDISATL
ncbi:hypothetical protein DPMN_151891 [Dreissena polymorpha]|uniref:Uncharacterized protein n=1 Tax=Dreissena polymorpha TaxID=45954 RepID=A0A9D4FFX2_DREPO|nr:hypothetical protein DPMN_151891 [Dreissena polymorpha]